MSENMENLSESSSRPIKILNGTQYSAETVAELMDSHFLSLYNPGDIGRDQCYCGITSDIYKNRSRHESEDERQIEYICVYECRDANIAGLVEQFMNDKGYDIGETETFANGGSESSVLVYLYKK